MKNKIIIDFAITRETHRFEAVIAINSNITNIRKINDVFSSFTADTHTDKNNNLIEMYANTERLFEVLYEDNIGQTIAA